MLSSRDLLTKFGLNFALELAWKLQFAGERSIVEEFVSLP